MRRIKNPWERMSNESDPAWEAFVLYRDMPEKTGVKRSCHKVALQLSKSDTIIKRWCSAHNWRQRCAEYDSYLDDKEIEERLKQRKEQIKQEEQMDERHIGISVQVQRTILDFLQQAQADEITPKGMADIARASQIAADLERESRHTTHADKQLELNRERFEYEKERDAGLNAELEDLDETEEEIYGNDNEDT